MESLCVWYVKHCYMTTFHRFQLFSIIFLIKFSILINYFIFLWMFKFWSMVHTVWTIQYGRNEMIPWNGKITSKRPYQCMFSRDLNMEKQIQEYVIDWLSSRYWKPVLGIKNYIKSHWLTRFEQSVINLILKWNQKSHY